MFLPPSRMFALANLHWTQLYDRNHYFGFGPIPKPKPKILVDTFGRYRNRYRNHISKEKSSFQ